MAKSCEARRAKIEGEKGEREEEREKQLQLSMCVNVTICKLQNEFQLSINQIWGSHRKWIHS